MSCSCDPSNSQMRGMITPPEMSRVPGSQLQQAGVRCGWGPLATAMLSYQLGGSAIPGSQDDQSFSSSLGQNDYRDSHHSWNCHHTDHHSHCHLRAYDQKVRLLHFTSAPCVPSTSYTPVAALVLTESTAGLPCL